MFHIIHIIFILDLDDLDDLSLHTLYDSTVFKASWNYSRSIVSLGMQSRGQASPISNQPSTQLQYSKQQQQQSFTSSTPMNMSSFDTVLSPEMSNFKSQQQSVAMGTLQQQQQRQQQQIRQSGIVCYYF